MGSLCFSTLLLPQPWHIYLRWDIPSLHTALLDKRAPPLFIMANTELKSLVSVNSGFVKNCWSLTLSCDCPFRILITFFEKTERRHTRQRLCMTGWTPTWAFSSQSSELNSFDFSLWTRIEEKFARHSIATQMLSWLLWTAHGGRWGQASLRRSARASDPD